MVSNKKARKFRVRLEKLLAQKAENVEIKDLIDLFGGEYYYKKVMTDKIQFYDTPISDVALQNTKYKIDRSCGYEAKAIGRHYPEELRIWMNINLRNLKVIYSQTS